MSHSRKLAFAAVVMFGFILMAIGVGSVVGHELPFVTHVHQETEYEVLEHHEALVVVRAFIA